MLVYPSAIDLSSGHLRHLVGHLAARRREIGTRSPAHHAGPPGPPGSGASALRRHLRPACRRVRHRGRDGLPLCPRGDRSPGNARSQPGPGHADREPPGLCDPRRHPAADRPNRRRHPVLLRQTQTSRHERPGSHRPVRPPAVGFARAARLHPRPDCGPHSRDRRSSRRCRTQVLGGQGIPRHAAAQSGCPSTAVASSSGSSRHSSTHAKIRRLGEPDRPTAPDRVAPARSAPGARAVSCRRWPM